MLLQPDIASAQASSEAVSSGLCIGPIPLVLFRYVGNGFRLPALCRTRPALRFRFRTGELADDLLGPHVGGVVPVAVRKVVRSPPPPLDPPRRADGRSDG